MSKAYQAAWFAWHGGQFLIAPATHTVRLVLTALILVLPDTLLAQECFGIQFLDQQDQRPIPLVEIETSDHVKWVSDNDGWIAIDDPELLGAQVFFHIRSHGYEFPKDGFGITGKSIPCTPGDRITISLKRTQLAQRLYRSTGIGRYSHTKRLGLPTTFPQENSQNKHIFESPIGCDSVLTAVLGDRMYWFWGDTSALHYPIGGSFHMTGATTSAGDLDVDSHPPQFEFFRDQGNRVRALAVMPGDGPTWISGVTVVKDARGDDVMLGNYVKIRNSLEAYRWGFVRWNTQTNRFDQVAEFHQAPKLFPPSQSHTLQHNDPSTNARHVYLCTPFPNRRVLASDSAYIDPDLYEGFTCLQDGTTFDDRKIDRDQRGKPNYRWRKNTLPLTHAQESALVSEGVIHEADRYQRVIDLDSGKEIQAHNGSVVWNPTRGVWSAVFTQYAGESSLLGEVWYAESKILEGPYCRAKKIASHHQYSFYNPKIHPEFTSKDGKSLYFEGTYTAAFSGNQAPTPRYDYNQIFYRLDLGSLDGLNFGD